MPTAAQAVPAKIRFWRHVVRGAAADCWLWTKTMSSSGYGLLRVGSRTNRTRRTITVHRFSWELHNGPIPEGEGYHGTCVCHTCDNKLCVNPGHLFLGSVTDNNRDREAKGRGRSTPPHKWGEDHSNAKLTADDVRTIRDVYARGNVTQVQLGRAFGVSRSAIHSITSGKNWKLV